MASQMATSKSTIILVLSWLTYKFSIQYVLGSVLTTAINLKNKTNKDTCQYNNHSIEDRSSEANS